MLRSAALPLRSVLSSSSPSALHAVPSLSPSVAAVVARRPFSILPAPKDRPLPPMPETVAVSPTTPDKDITFRFDPSAYVYLRPKASIGMDTTTVEYMPQWLKRLVRPLAVAIVSKNKQSIAIEATRNFLGQASDGLVRSEEFFWEGQYIQQWRYGGLEILSRAQHQVGSSSHPPSALVRSAHRRKQTVSCLGHCRLGTRSTSFLSCTCIIPRSVSPPLSLSAACASSPGPLPSLLPNPIPRLTIMPPPFLIISFLRMYIPRLRALPARPAKLYQQELLTHFFSLLEVRMRRTLGPRIPESFIKKYMIDYGNQFAGGRFAFDKAVLGSDTDLAMFLWRNVLGARGQPEGSIKSGLKIPTGLNNRKRVEHLSKVGKADGMGGKIRLKDLDGKMEGEGRIGPVPTTLESPPQLSAIPETWDPLLIGEELDELVGFVRREMKRLETIPDQVLLKGSAGAFGPVREEDAKVWDQIIREKAVKFVKEQGSDELPIREDMKW